MDKSRLVFTILPVVCFSSVIITNQCTAAEAVVTNIPQLRQVLSGANPGTHVRIAPGHYPANLHLSDLKGTEAQRIVVEAADPMRPPVFDATSGGLQLSGCAYLELKNLVITNFSHNGINLDDAGRYNRPAQGIVLTGLRVYGTSPKGNCDAIKLSGLVQFEIRACTLSDWGTGGGSGIDMVGCHRGVIESNRLTHTDTIGSTGIQAKGDTSHVLIRRNHFQNAGGRAVNIGGSTGLEFFRPPLKPGETHSEASNITVEGNTFIGSTAPIAFVGVDVAVVRWNTIYRPLRWTIRILQETRTPGFVPSRRGMFFDNIVVFDSKQWAEGGVNVGAGTDPATFRFARNWWYCLDHPERSEPKLPSAEEAGIYGRDPELRDPTNGDFDLKTGSPAQKHGASALP